MRCVVIIFYTLHHTSFLKYVSCLKALTLKKTITNPQKKFLGKFCENASLLSSTWDV